jgi:hypothetical protein
MLDETLDRKRRGREQYQKPGEQVGFHPDSSLTLRKAKKLPRLARERADETIASNGFPSALALLALADDEEGERKQISDKKGARSVEKTANFNKIERDSEGRIRALIPDWTHHKDRKLEVEYGDLKKPKNPTKLTFADQSTLKKTKDQWELYDKNGKRTDTIPGLPKIDAEKITDVGIDQKTGALKITLTDDTTITKYPDGSAIVRNSDGKPTKIWTARDFFSNSGREIDVEWGEDGKENQVIIGDAGGGMIFQKKGKNWAGGQQDAQSDKFTRFPAVKDVTVDLESGTVYVDFGRGYKVEAEGPDGKVIKGEVKKGTIGRDKKLEFYGGGGVVIDADGKAKEIVDKPDIPAKAEIARAAEHVAKALKGYEKNPNARTSDGRELPFRSLTREQSADIEEAFEAALAKGPKAVTELETATNKKLKEQKSPYKIHFAEKEPKKDYVVVVQLGDKGYAVVSRRSE